MTERQGDKKPPWAATKKLTPEIVTEILKEGARFINPPYQVFMINGSICIMLSSCPKCKRNSIVGNEMSGKDIIFRCDGCASSFRLVEEE